MLAVSINSSSHRRTAFACATLQTLLVLSGCATTCDRYVSCGTASCNSFCGPGTCEDTCGAVGTCGTQNVIPTEMSACDSRFHELQNTSVPEYRRETPENQFTETATHVWPSPERVQTGESLVVQVNRPIPTGRNQTAVAQPFRLINGVYIVDTDGYLNLGPAYGKVHVAAQSLNEIQKRVDTHLQHFLSDPQVLVTLPNPQDAPLTTGGQPGGNRPQVPEPSTGPRLFRGSHETSHRYGRLSRFRTVARRSTYQPRLPSQVETDTGEAWPNQPAAATTPSETFHQSQKIPAEPSSGHSPITAPQPQKSRPESNSNASALPAASGFGSSALQYQY